MYVEVFDPMNHDTSGLDLLALEQLVIEAQTTSGGCSVAEIGCWAGLTTKVLARTADRVYCVDHWKGNVNDRLGDVARQIGQEKAILTFCNNMQTDTLGKSSLFGRVFPCIGDSLMWAKIFELTEVRFGLVFIDASHDYEDVKADIEAWRKLVRKGGIICGHDYTTFPGVYKAVNEAFNGEAGAIGSSIWHYTIQ